MKLTKIALTLACLLGTAQVFAAPVTAAQIESARQAGTLQQAWISGASAPSKSIYEGWVGNGTGAGCDANSNTIFSNQATTAVIPGSLGNFNAYACTRGGVVSVLYHTIDGGSLLAYAPHTVGAKLARVKYVGGTANGCGATALTYTDATNTRNNAAVYKGCALVGIALPGTGPTAGSNNTNAAAVAADALAPQLPVGGFSDVEASLFSPTIGGGDVSSKGTEGQANVGQVFGIVVSTPLYRALQSAQGLSDVDGSTYDPVKAPNITSAQYVSIIAQGGAYQTDWSPIVGAAGNGKKVILARRVQTSGSQASSNAFFLKNPCASGVSANLTPATVIDSSPTFEVLEGSGTGNVKTRLSQATTAGDFAIGVISAENDWRADAAASAGYRYIKIDGNHPETGDIANARVTAATGAYPFHMELRNFTANTATGFGAAVVNQITASLANPPTSACAVLPRGLTLNPLGGSSCTVGVQVAKGTNLGNNCSPAQLTQ